jgi:hypothetical protein
MDDWDAAGVRAGLSGRLHNIVQVPLPLLTWGAFAKMVDEAIHAVAAGFSLR